ncbi:S-layer homology domain-containing protein, partial [Pseudomonadota bacterium]
MNKINKKLLLLIVVLNIAVAPVAKAETELFSDLTDRNPNFRAIEYLTETGIIQGYPDGTFQADKTVSRVEFLKLALLSSKIEMDNYIPTGFPDIDENAWYAQYVRKAASMGWVEGYPDGTFKPTQGVNKAEALKMIGEIQEWEIDTDLTESYFSDISPSEWFAPYTEYAHSKNFLDERGTFFAAEAHLSRGKVSEYLFRAFITNLSDQEQFSYSLIEEYPASENIVEVIEVEVPV